MKKRKNQNQIVRYFIVLLTGMCLYGFLQGAILAVRGRVGVIGGEVLILPLLAGMIYFGWILCDTYRNVVRERRDPNEAKPKMR